MKVNLNQSVKVFDPSHSPFESIYVDITHRCQMACANCYLPNRTIPDMDTELLMEMLKQLPSKADIRLIGGEPTLRDDLASVISQIANIGHRPMLITNGLRLSELNYCLTLKEAGLEYAQISLNGFNDDKIYKILDNMECATQKMEAIKNCETVGIGVSVSMIVVKKLNSHLIYELINYAKSSLKKPVRLNFRNVGDIGRSMSGIIDNSSFDEIIEMIANHIGISSDEVKKYKTRDNQIRFPLKTGPKRSDTIWIKVTDWERFPMNISTPEQIKNNSIKGRVTQEFKLAPFFDHVKSNQFGY